MSKYVVPCGRPSACPAELVSQVLSLAAMFESDMYCCMSTLSELSYTSPLKYFAAMLQIATQQQVRELNTAIVEGKTDREARLKVEQKLEHLAEQAELFKTQGEQALEKSKQAQEAAAQTQAQAAQEIAQAREQAQDAIERAANAHAQMVREARQEMERAVAAGKHDREARGEAERKIAELVREAEAMKELDQRALQDANRAREAVAHASQQLGRSRLQPVHVGENRSTSVKWVIVQNEAGPLEAKADAREVLKYVRDGEPLNLLTIVGAARRGKSFLMNALTGSDNIFLVSPEEVACTAGADLSPILMPLAEFERGGGGSRTRGPASANQPTIAFVDMEGHGDKSEEHDVRLAAPFLLLSKVRA